MVHILLKNPQLFSTVLARSAHTCARVFRILQEGQQGRERRSGGRVEGEWRGIPSLRSVSFLCLLRASKIDSGIPEFTQRVGTSISSVISSALLPASLLPSSHKCRILMISCSSNSNIKHLVLLSAPHFHPCRCLFLIPWCIDEWKR